MPQSVLTSLLTPSRTPSNSTLINYPPSTLSMDESFEKLSVKLFKNLENSQHRNPKKFHFYSQPVAMNDRPHFNWQRFINAKQSFGVGKAASCAHLFMFPLPINFKRLDHNLCRWRCVCERSRLERAQRVQEQRDRWVILVEFFRNSFNTLDWMSLRLAA